MTTITVNLSSYKILSNRIQTFNKGNPSKLNWSLNNLRIVTLWSALQHSYPYSIYCSLKQGCGSGCYGRIRGFLKVVSGSGFSYKSYPDPGFLKSSIRIRDNSIRIRNPGLEECTLAFISICNMLQPQAGLLIRVDFIRIRIRIRFSEKIPDPDPTIQKQTRSRS